MYVHIHINVALASLRAALFVTHQMSEQDWELMHLTAESTRNKSSSLVTKKTRSTHPVFENDIICHHHTYVSVSILLVPPPPPPKDSGQITYDTVNILTF